MTAAAVLPKPVAQEILRRYADVLRVGSVEVNGQTIKWHTDTSNEQQLENFSAALFGRLRQLPELARAADGVLRQASFWVCKAVSINYALIEVLLLVKRKVGVMCTIETRDDAGALVSYSIEARPTQVMHIRLSWRGKNNIVYRDPLTATKKVKGTLTCVETEFCLPPAQRFAPSYRVQVKFEKSMAAKFVSTVTCREPRGRGGVSPTETILIQDPLRSEFPLDSPENLNVTALEPLDIDSYCEDLRRTISSSSQLPPSSPNSSGVDAEPRSFTARSVRLPLPTRSVESIAEADAQPVGRLRVRVLRLRGLARRRHPLGGSPGDAAELYCRCSVGSRTEQTRLSPDGASTEWCEAWDFPVQEQDMRGEVLAEVLEAGREPALLGRVRVPVSRVLSNGGKALVADALDGVASGSIELELELLTDDLGEMSHESDCLIEVGTIPPSVSMSLRRSWAV